MKRFLLGLSLFSSMQIFACPEFNLTNIVCVTNDSDGTSTTNYKRIQMSGTVLSFEALNGEVDSISLPMQGSHGALNYKFYCDANTIVDSKTINGNTYKVTWSMNGDSLSQVGIEVLGFYDDGTVVTGETHTTCK